MKSKIENIIIGISAALIICGVIYGAYWLAKTVSYQVFYKDMVEHTVKEMVKPEYLKH